MTTRRSCVTAGGKTAGCSMGMTAPTPASRAVIPARSTGRRSAGVSDVLAGHQVHHPVGDRDGVVTEPLEVPRGQRDVDDLLRRQVIPAAKGGAERLVVQAVQE